MATAYSTLMGLAEPVQGELSGTWGDTVNKGITEYLDVALAGTQTISGSQTAVTLSLTNGNASATNIAQVGAGATGSAQFAVINCTGNPGSLLTITVPASSRQYIVINATSTSQSVKVVGVGPTTGVTIAAGRAAHIAWNGSDFTLVATTDAARLSGILAVANGGTGLSSGTSGGVPYFSGSNTIASSAALAANALVVGGGAGAAPSTVTTGTGVVTALGVNTGTAGAFVVNGGALGTPSSGTVTNLTGTASININGTVGATTANTGAFTSITSTSASGITQIQAATQDGVKLLGRAGGTGSYLATITPTTLTASRTVTLPDASTTVPVATQVITFSGPTAARTYTFPDASTTVLTTNAAVTVAQGGTGATTLTANNVILGNGTSAPLFVAPGTNGNVLTSNGTTWVSSAGATVSAATPTVLGTVYGKVDTTNSNFGFGQNTLANFSLSGTNNTAVGKDALNANTSGTSNTAIGSVALRDNTTGSNNSAFGWYAMILNSTGSSNTASGVFSMFSNTVASNNTAYGYQSLYSNTINNNNTAIGRSALQNSDAANNTALGFYSGLSVSSGQQNTLVGAYAGSSGTNDLTTGSNNIIIGYNAEASSATVSNEVTIGNTSITSTRLRGMVELNAAMFEKATISATAATGTINFDARTQSVLYYTTNASGNWTLNIRAASGVSLDSVMTTGESMTVAFLVTNGATAYYQTGFTIDGTSVTPKWQGGTAPTAGNASSIDTYVITVIKTGAATFTVLASQTKFA